MRGTPTLASRALNRATLARQGLLQPLATPSVASAIENLGSLQAQHPEWPPVALASRAADSATADLAGALRRREVVRSSLMRLTIHIVSAADLWPMFAICQPLRLNQWRLLTRADPVDSDLGRALRAAHGVAIDALRERPRSSMELDRLMAQEVGGSATGSARRARRQADLPVPPRAAWRHFSAFVPLVHVPFDGEGYGRSRYAIAADWLGVELPEVDEHQARIGLARRYFGAFGPASIDDLLAYVGRGKGGTGPWRKAIEELGQELMTFADEAGRVLYDLRTGPRPPADAPAPPRLLARWDSLLLSHAPRHRQRVIADRDRPVVFSRNADVLPTFLVDGTAAGTWDLQLRDGGAHICLRPFRALKGSDADALLAESKRLLLRIAPRAETRSASIAT